MRANRFRSRVKIEPWLQAQSNKVNEWQPPR